MQTLPLITQRTRTDVIGINGQPIFSYHQQLLSLLKKEGGDQSLALSFAEPVTNVLRGEISWVTKLEGPVRAFDVLTPEQKLEVVKRISQLSQQVRSVADKVAAGAGASSAYGAQALRGMLSTPDALGSTFMVGDQVVLAQWGCVPYGEKLGNFDVDRSFAQAFKPAEKLIAAEQKALAPASAIGFATVFRWLVLAGLALLLLLGIFHRQWLSVIDPGPSIAAEEAARARVAELWSKVDEKALMCFPPAVVAPEPANVVPTPIPGVVEPPGTPTTVSSSEIERRLEENSVAQGKYVNVALAWKSQADLDLIVTEPSGVSISMYNNNVRKSPSGGSLDIDANACTKMSGCPVRAEPIENISWNQKPPSGQYQVSVALFSANTPVDQRVDIPFTILITVDGKKTTHEGVIKVSDMVCGDRCRSKVRMKVASFNIP
jgi:hypothetical protein